MFRSHVKNKPHRKAARRQPTPRGRFFRPRLEALEVRLTPSTIQIKWEGDVRTVFEGEWFAKINGLPGDTSQVQLAAAQALLKGAGIESDVQATKFGGSDGVILLEVPADMDYNHLAFALKDVPGIQAVEPYFADDGDHHIFSQLLDKENMDDMDPLPPGGGGSGPPVTSINGFDGLNFQGNACGCSPPDTIGAAGPSSYVETVNTAMGIYNKVTGALVGKTELTPFFNAGLGGGVLSLSDPVVVYDEMANQFFVGILDYSFGGQSRFDVAISKISNPTTSASDWTFRRYNVDDRVGGFDFADYPKIGYNADGYVISNNMFLGGFSYDHVTTLSIRKSDLTGFLNVVPNGFRPFTFAPAAMHTSAPGSPMWFVENGNDNENGGNTVTVVKMTNAYSSSPTFTFTPITVNAYGAAPNPRQPGGILGGRASLETRFYFSALRNVGGVTRLVSAHAVGSGGGERARWYEFNVDGATPALMQQGEINQGAGVDTFFPDVDIGPTGAMGMTFSQSSGTAPSGYLSMYVTGRALSDAPGTMQTPILVKQGTALLNAFGRAGDYSFTSIDPVDGTFWSANEYAAPGGSPNWFTWIAHFRAEPPAGPSVINQVPANPVGLISSLRLTFDESIDIATFTPAKIVSFTDPTGAAITVSGVAAVAGTNNTQFDVSFPAQTLLGNYVMTIGPDVRDTFGHQMDQNHNGIPGEDPGDQYVGRFTLQGPKIIASLPTGSSLPALVDHVRVTFNEPMDPATFTTDRVSFTGPGGPFNVNNVVAVAGSNNTQFDVLVDPVASTGAYDMIIGPGILDPFGHSADVFDAKFTLLGPKIIASSIPPGTTPNFLPGALTSVQVTFNEPMDPNAFGLDQVVLTAPDGSTYLASDVVPVAGSNNTRFNLLFTANVTGSYVLTIGPNVFDPFGNAMDQNGNLITGEIPGDQYVLKFNVLGPRINSSFTFGDSFNQLFNDVRVAFNEPMDPTSFTADQVVFKGPAGNTISVTGITPVAGTNNTQFDLGFDFQGKIGNYTMTIGPNVFDSFGNAMDQNGNLKTGEIPGDQYVHRFTVFGPRINFTSPSGSLEPVNTLRVTFSKPIDVATFTPSKLSNFNGPGGPIGVDGIFVVPGSNNTQFDVAFRPQTITGRYSLTIGPDIRDLAGNKMDQNNNLIGGEIPGDQFTATFTVGSLRITTSPNGGNFQPGALDHVRLTFNEAVNPATFTPAQIVSFTGPGGAFLVTGVTAVPFTNNTQFDVAFDPLGTTGSYTLVVGPGMQDLYGNKLDQNGNLIPGEDPGDRYTFSFGVLGPKVTGAISLKSGLHSISGVRLTFSEAMDPTTFTPDKVVLKSPSGATIPVTDVSPTDGSNTQFDVSFEAQTTGGSYVLTVGPDVEDPFGNQMDQNGNLRPGEIPGDQFVYRFDPSQVNLLYVGSHFTSWNDGSLFITQISTAQFATQSFAGFDEIWVDETVNGGDPNVTRRAADLAAFVNAGGGLITDTATIGNYSFVPNASSLRVVSNFCNDDVKETTLGNSHPILAGITDAGLSNWRCSWHSYFSATAGMDVLATSSNPSQALLLAGNFGAGRLVYFGMDPTFHWPAGQSVQLMRQAAKWAGSGLSGGPGAAPGEPSVVPPLPPANTVTPADRVFASLGTPAAPASRSLLDGVLAVSTLAKASPAPAWTVLKGPDVPAPAAGAGALDPRGSPAPREELPLSPVGVKPETRSAADPFDPLADAGDLWNWGA